MEEIKFKMFKIIGGNKIHNFELTAMSLQHAKIVAKDFHNRCGLIGRYYCETSCGDCFQIT